MRVRMPAFAAAVATAFALAVPAASGASVTQGPTLTLERVCSDYPPRHEVNVTLAGVSSVHVVLRQHRLP
jgi:hypothetical protein